MSDLIATPLDPAEFAIGEEADQAVGVTTDGCVVLLSTYAGPSYGARHWMKFTREEASRYGKLLIEGAERAADCHRGLA